MLALTFGLQPVSAAAVELIRDPHVRRGLILLSPQPGKRVPYGTLAGPEAGPAVWDLAQWSSRYPLKAAGPQRRPDGTSQFSNAGKSITFGRPGSNEITLAVTGSIEYGGKARKKDDPWVHLLLQQEIANAPALAELKSARFHLEARLQSSHHIVTPEDTPDLHAAQFQVFFSVQNFNRKSAGYGQSFWFGVPVYDNRYRIPPAHQSQDTAGTQMFIFTPAGTVYGTRSAHDLQWITFDQDLLPLMREGLALAWQRGFLHDSQALADYHVSGLNLGWEVPGVFDVALQFRNLSLRATLSP